MRWFVEGVTAATIVLLLLAAGCDVAIRIIPDSLSITLLVLGIAGRAVTGLPDLAVSAGLAAVLSGLLVPAHGRGWVGGGDVKLVATIAVGLSPESLYRFLVVTALVGGALALLYLILRQALHGAATRPPPNGTAFFLRRIVAAERWRVVRRGSLPYGVAIACGGIWAVLADRVG